MDYVSCESELKFLKDGIIYDDLPDDEKEIYEATFETEDGKIPESIDSSALNQWLFNEDTIRKVLNEVMTKGIKVDYGERIGKTIIFAKNHRHAEKYRRYFIKSIRIWWIMQRSLIIIQLMRKVRLMNFLTRKTAADCHFRRYAGYGH